MRSEKREESEAALPAGGRRAAKSPPHYLQFAARVSSLLLGTEAPWE